LTGHTRDDHGGGLRVTASNPRIRNNVISGNRGVFIGGGIYVSGGAAHLAKNRIEDNALLDEGTGAGVAIETATAELFDNVIVNNRIPAMGSDGFGGGVGIIRGSAVLRNNRIEGNHAAGPNRTGHGGGVYSFGSKVEISGGTISRNELGNGAGAGAGLDILGTSEVRIERVSIRGNIGSETAAAGASGIHAEMSKLIVVSSIIADNKHGSAGISIGPLGSYVIFNCTISGNAAKGVRSQSSFTIVNSVIMQEPLGIEAVANTPATYSDQFNSNVFFGTSTVATGVVLDSSNITVDPKLNADLHLTADSPLIDGGRSGSVLDAGSANVVEPPATDIDGDSRAVAGRAGNAALPDIGADEYLP
jgi:hypothetical protein